MHYIKYIVPFIAVVFAASCSGNKAKVAEAKSNPTALYSWQTNDAQLDAAAQQASLTLDSFTTAVQSNKPGLSNFALKIRFPGLGGAEDLWAVNIKTTPAGFAGVINNIPQKTIKVKEGTPIKFTRQNITDWMYTENGVLHGGYTIKLIESRMTAKEKAKLDTAVVFKVR